MRPTHCHPGHALAQRHPPRRCRVARPGVLLENPRLRLRGSASGRSPFSAAGRRWIATKRPRVARAPRWQRALRRLSAVEGEVRDSARRGHGFDLKARFDAFEVVPESLAPSEDDRHEDKVHVVDEVGGEELGCHPTSPYKLFTRPPHARSPVASSCRFAWREIVKSRTSSIVPLAILENAVERGLLIGRLGSTHAEGNPLCAAVRPPAIKWSAAPGTS